MAPSEFSLLPAHVRPLKYRITLTPDLASYTFAGEESVDIEVTEPTAEITMNALELRVQAARVIRGRGRGATARDIRYDEAAQTVTLAFRRPVPQGRARLEIQFTGQLNDRLHGFYRSRYQTPGGEARVLACTQFEATDARRAFPCWDEPALKASFELTLVVPAHLTAIANTPTAKEATAGPGLRRVTFAETPVMSTYLLAFAVGEFESIQATAPNGTLVRVWATPGKAEQGRFALDASVRLLAFFNGYFGIPYPLPKLDHIAIPDFAAGAMENWGAITYRETALLVDPANSSAGTRQRVAEVVAHEMAHMWFGDLVTMEWWNDLWLNESFASWMGTKAVAHLFPDWQMWTQFLVDDVAPGLALDGLKSSHPIEQTVRNPAEVNQLFDAISYNKGASILRMLEQFLGEETFQRGLRAYLSAHQYANARGAHLWQALGEASGRPVPSLMERWIRQTGYPVLQAQVRRQDGGAEVHLSQRRFLYDQEPGDLPEPTVWPVPVAVTSSGAPGADSLLLDASSGSVRLDQGRPAPGGLGWVKVNRSQTGFYRVNYPPEEWERFIPAIQSLQLPPADRLGLENDAYALCRAGLIPATQFLALARAFQHETEYALWSDLAGNLRYLDLLLAREAFLTRFHAFARELLQSVVQRLGWDPQPGEGHLQALLRSTVLGALGYFGEAAILEESRRRFASYERDPASLAPDLRGVVFGLAAQGGDAETHEALRGLARQAALQEEKMRLLAAMARFQQPELLRRTLELSLSPEVRTQDTVSLVGAVAANRAGREPAWEFVKARWGEFDRRYGSGGFGLMRLVGITGSLTRLEQRQDVEAFFQAHPAPAASRTVQQSLERIRQNARWLEGNRAGLAEWLGRNSRS